MKRKSSPTNRRGFLALGAGAVALVNCEKPQTVEELPATSGVHMRPYGHRSPHETTVRVIRELTASALTSVRRLKSGGLVMGGSSYFGGGNNLLLGQGVRVTGPAQYIALAVCNAIRG